MMADVYWVESTITKNEAEKYLRKKQIDNRVEMVCLPYRLYTFEIMLKRFLLKSRRLKLLVLLNGVTGECNPVQLDLSELKSGYPYERYIPFKVNPEEYLNKSKNAALFYAMKHFYIIKEPVINCIDKYDIYYPFWEYDSGFYVNGRRLTLEKV